MAARRRPSRPITEALAAKAKYLMETKGLYQHQVAAELGVNQGRISEIKTGKRFPKTPPDNNQLDLGL